jgi:hypothetical protein
MGKKKRPRRVYIPPLGDRRNVERGKQWLKEMIDGIGKKKPEEIISSMIPPKDRSSTE